MTELPGKMWSYHRLLFWYLYSTLLRSYDVYTIFSEKQVFPTPEARERMKERIEHNSRMLDTLCCFVMGLIDQHRDEQRENKIYTPAHVFINSLGQEIDIQVGMDFSNGKVTVSQTGGYSPYGKVTGRKTIVEGGNE